MKDVPIPVLTSLLKQHAPDAPEVIGSLAKALTELGYQIDLGPMTPDARKHAAAIDADIEARLRARRSDANELERRKTDPHAAIPREDPNDDDAA